MPGSLIVIFQLLILLLFANGAPVVAKRIFEKRFTVPLDVGVLFFDGRPIFGSSKTIRGLVASILATTFCAPLIGLSLTTGLLIAAGSMAGDLFSSFVKRRMNLGPGSMALGLDQIPESLFPLLVCRQLLALTMGDIVAVVIIFFVGELILSRILYKMHIRDHPY